MIHCAFIAIDIVDQIFIVPDYFVSTLCLLGLCSRWNWRKMYFETERYMHDMQILVINIKLNMKFDTPNLDVH